MDRLTGKYSWYLSWVLMSSSNVVFFNIAAQNVFLMYNKNDDKPIQKRVAERKNNI